VTFCRELVATSQFGVNRICQLTGISKTTYYQAENPQTKLELKHQKLKDTVEKIILRNPAYGIRRIKAELFEVYQIFIGRDKLAKLLPLWEFSIKRQIVKNQPSLLQKILIKLAGRANLLIRSVIDEPFQAVTSDITELSYKGGKAYLCVHKDVFGQMVYGFSLGLTMETSLVLASYKMAIKRIKKLCRRLRGKIIIHQDRGSQYTSYDYVATVLKENRLSYSDPGTPTHNPGQESFFGRFKGEWADEIAEIETFEQLIKFVTSKLKYYNQERRHTSLGLVSPEKFTKSFLNKKP